MCFLSSCSSLYVWKRAVGDGKRDLTNEGDLSLEFRPEKVGKIHIIHEELIRPKVACREFC